MYKINPKLDLVLERVTDVKPSTVWKALTMPEHIIKWGVPKPWTLTECELDLKPGEIHKLTMKSPEGQIYPNPGCVLEVVENKKLVWSSALLAGFRPSQSAVNPPGLLMTAIITIEPHGTGTKYIATVLHADEKTKKTHEEMGFHGGWGTCFDQMVAVAQQIK